MQDKRMSAVILKMDENNQYGNAMTKPLPIGCIKKEPKIPNNRKLCLLLSSLSHLDTIGHLYVVDIEFNFERATEKELFFKEIYTPLFEKKKVLPARDRSAFELFDAIRLKDNTTLNNYKYTAKIHSTMDKKFLVPLHAEQLKFLLERCFWSVTKMHQHFTFRQEMFKKDFVVSNQVARQNAKTPVEKNFYKLMNNANFGYDCRNNFENRYFTPVVDEIEEMAYVRKHQNVYDPDHLINYFSPDHLRMQINEDFNNKLAKISTRDEYYEAKRNSPEIERKKQLDSVESLMKKLVKNHYTRFRTV